MHLSRPLIAFPRPLRLPRAGGAVAALRAVAVPGSVAGGAPALHARIAQERLVAHGHLPADAVTGRYDRRTLDAIARFQAASLLPIDGELDARTADALLQGPAQSSGRATDCPAATRPVECPDAPTAPSARPAPADRARDRRGRTRAARPGVRHER